MKNATRIITLAVLGLSSFALSSCATEGINERQSSRTSAAESRQDRYDARYSGRRERREMRADRADARMDAW